MILDVKNTVESDTLKHSSTYPKRTLSLQRLVNGGYARVEADDTICIWDSIGKITHSHLNFMGRDRLPADAQIELSPYLEVTVTSKDGNKKTYDVGAALGLANIPGAAFSAFRKKFASDANPNTTVVNASSAKP